MTYGIFDSGEGGHNLLRYARMRNDRDDIIFLCDRARAPYGTKRDFELSGIVNDNIERLRRMGAERIIIACCTACTVFERIEDKSEVYPILPSTARVARGVTDGRIAVLATGATVRSGAFRRELGGEVTEIAAQPLVALIDGGASDKQPTGELTAYLRELLERADGADTVILGCTHFSSVKGLIRQLGAERGIRRIIDAAEVGADLIDCAHEDGKIGIDYVINTKNTNVGH